jgi:CheY-like chemotaxis protein
MKVMVLEDDKIAQLGIRKILSNLEFKIELVLLENGREGLDYLLGNPEATPDLILLDINMPIMNGHEFLEALRKNQEWQDLPVVIHTTSNNPGDLNKSRALGVMGYFVKHIDYAQYKLNLENIMRYWAESMQKNSMQVSQALRLSI